MPAALLNGKQDISCTLGRLTGALSCIDLLQDELQKLQDKLQNYDCPPQDVTAMERELAPKAVAAAP